MYVQGIGEHIAGINVDPFSRQVVEEELGAISATALATYIADRLIKASKLIVSMGSILDACRPPTCNL